MELAVADGEVARNKERPAVEGGEVTGFKNGAILSHRGICSQKTKVFTRRQHNLYELFSHHTNA
jgi:hypothetical protein